MWYSTVSANAMLDVKSAMTAANFKTIKVSGLILNISYSNARVKLVDVLQTLGVLAEENVFKSAAVQTRVKPSLGELHVTESALQEDVQVLLAHDVVPLMLLCLIDQL